MSEPIFDTFAVERLIQGFTPPALPQRRPDRATIDAADRNARQWTSHVTGTLKPGSDVHRREMCRMFRETFNPYRPSVLDWPNLEPDALERIVSLPIWDIAMQTEGGARLRMAAYAATVNEPDIREALALNAWEESRHKEVLSRMVTTYGISLATEAPYVYPKDTEWAYLVTGYSECIDSFFAFGLFEVARRSGLFPPELIEHAFKERRRFLARHRNGLRLENSACEHDPVRRFASQDDGDVERGRDNAEVLPLRQGPRQLRGRGAAVENDRAAVRHKPRRLAADFPTYDLDHQAFQMELLRGAVYEYAGVGQDEYEGFMDAESKGKYFLANIKDRYACVKL
jgi:hypothetical protein